MSSGLRTIKCDRHGVEVVVADKGDNVVRRLDGGLVRSNHFTTSSKCVADIYSFLYIQIDPYLPHFSFFFFVYFCRFRYMYFLLMFFKA